ncbi:MAG: TonB-dependent receptor [Chitinophagales bacterium]|nr:TonB-dependent receptor [Chitinophagales bacterium]
MNTHFKHTLIAILALLPIIGFAQTGKISGIIIDKTTQETLIGVNISVAGSTQGATTDIEGKYEIADLTPGIYKLVFTYIGYADKNVENVDVKAEETTTLNVSLELATNELSEVQVVDFKKTNSETAVLLEMKNATQITSGISSQQIQKTADRDAAQVVRRIPGVSIQSNFINIRGLNQRYNNVLLHNAMAPSMEADVKSFAFDIIPSAQLDRIIVLKSPSADVVGEFAGGMVKIFTKSFPDNNFVDISYGTTFRVGTTFKPFFNQKNGPLFYLANDPKNNLPSGFSKDVNALSLQQQVDAGKQLNNNWTAQKQASIPDQRIGISFGRRITTDKMLIGMITSINYSISKQTFNIFRADYNIYDFANNKQDAKYNYTDEQYNNNVRLGILHNWAFKFGKNTIEFKNIFNSNGLSQYTHRTGTDLANDLTVDNHALYNAYKGIYAGQLLGKHQVKTDNNAIDWVVGYSRAYRKEPDFKRYTSTLNTATNIYEINVLPTSVNPNSLGRFFSDMQENIVTVAVNSTNKILKAADKGIIPSINGGAYVEYKNRDFNARILGFKRSDFDLFDYNFATQGIDVLMQNINTTNGIKLGEQTRSYDSYKANNLIGASYVNTELSIKSKVRIVAGFRYEYSNQHLTSGTQSDLIEVKNIKHAYLPSVNISYNITPKMLVRAAYGMSVNRPEFREIAPFAFDDFYTRYTIEGNPNLKNATVHNADIKYEFYPSNGEVISVSAFYKKFLNPIESKAVVGTSGSTFSFANAYQSDVAGVEIEFKKSFTTAKNYFIKHLGLMANASYIYSKVNLGKENVGQSDNRPLQGQSPYSINAGIFFEDKELGLQANLLYNVIGKRIAFVGTDDNPDIYEMSRHVLDFNIQYRFKKNVEISLSANDLINQPILFLQDGNRDKKWNRSTDQVFQKYQPGQTVSLGVKYNF